MVKKGTMIDTSTGDALYPQTSLDNVFDENGKNLGQIIKDLKEILNVALFPLSASEGYLEVGDYSEWVAAGKPTVQSSGEENEDETIE